MDLETQQLLNNDNVLKEVLKRNGISELSFVTYNLQSTSEIIDSKLGETTLPKTNFKTKSWYKIAATVTFCIFYVIILISTNYGSNNNKIGLIIFSVLIPLGILYFWVAKKFNNFILISGKELTLKSEKIEWKEIYGTYILTTGTKQSEHYLILTLKNQNFIQENISGIINSGNSIITISESIEYFKQQN